MKFEDLKFTETNIPKGIQALVKFGEYELSIINNEVSYGGKNGGTLYEIAVYDNNNNMIEMPGITEEGDTVKGFLCEEGVTVIMKKMTTITGDDGQNLIDTIPH